MGVISAYSGAGTVTFNGVNSASLGIYVEHFPDHMYPERDYNVVHVPGRNGDIVVDQGSYKNVDRDYDLVIASDTPGDFHSVATVLNRWLHSGSGYLQLTDSYEPGVYRLAMYKESHIITNVLNQAARATVTFACKPQCFLTTGAVPVTLTDAGTDPETNLPIRSVTLTNPTPYPAKPTLFIKWSNSTGIGLVLIGSRRLTILSHNSGEYILDCENQDMYGANLGTNLNGALQMDSNNSDFPVLPGGETTVVRVIGNTSEVTITPRWWQL